MRILPRTLIFLFISVFAGLSDGQTIADKRYQDGTYRGTSTGHVDDVTVKVMIKNHKVVDIKVVEHAEYEHKEAIAKMPARILKIGDLESVDAVSEATETSTAILSAVREALQNALPEGEKVMEEIPGTQYTGDKTSLGARTWIPTPVWVIGSYDKADKSNFMTAAWVGIACSRPPCVTISLRKATYTYGTKGVHCQPSG